MFTYIYKYNLVQLYKKISVEWNITLKHNFTSSRIGQGSFMYVFRKCTFWITALDFICKLHHFTKQFILAGLGGRRYECSLENNILNTALFLF